MIYIALLRGINAGKFRRVDMNKLKVLFESLGYLNVSTYINSGNVLFESEETQENIHKKIENSLEKEFDFDIPILVKTKKEIEKIANIIPNNWQNDSLHRTDVAYLFKEIDSKKTLDKIPTEKEYIDIRYIKGAIYWNAKRKKYNQSQLNKLIGNKLYRLMTLRNINTARHLAQHK